MLGALDSVLPGLTNDTFRGQVNEFMNILQEHKVFVFVMTPVGFRDFFPGFDSRVDRLEELNKIILWEAGLHRYPVIDVGEYMGRLRMNNAEKYRSMFSNEYQLNEMGQRYVLEYVVKHIKKAMK